MPFNRIRCLLNRHRPLRRTVEWNGFAYNGSCEVCGVPIRRKSKGGWRKVLESADDAKKIED